MTFIHDPMYWLIACGVALFGAIAGARAAEELGESIAAWSALGTIVSTGLFTIAVAAICGSS